MLHDLWISLWPWILSTGITILGTLSFIGLAPTAVVEKLFGHALDRKLAELKHAQDSEIEALKAKLNRISDRSVRANEREYNAVITAWESFVDAYINTLRCIYAYLSHPDFSKMSVEQLADHLATTDLSEPQKKQMFSTTDRNGIYSKIIQQRQIAEADNSIYVARSVLRKQGIFIPETLEKQFEDALQILSVAQIHKQISFEHGHFKDDSDPIGKVLKDGSQMEKNIKDAVRERIFFID